MKNLLFFILIVCCLSCGQKSNSDIEVREIKQVQVTFERKDELTNTFHRKKIEPDFFPISTTDFAQYKLDHTKWFISDNGKNRLYFVPYTDYAITEAILTNRDISDKDLIEILKSDSVEIGNMNKAIFVDEIKSKKGIHLGLFENDVIKIFGEPNSRIKKANGTIFNWCFSMLESKTNNRNQVGGLIPFVLNDLEFKIEMTFSNSKLVEVIYSYEVP